MFKVNASPPGETVTKLMHNVHFRFRSFFKIQARHVLLFFPRKQNIPYINKIYSEMMIENN